MRAGVLLIVIATLLPMAALAALLGATIVGAENQPDFFSGDANCDGQIDSLDALAVLQFEAQLIDELAFPQGGDPDKDGAVDSTDALLILQFDAGLMPSRTADVCVSIPPGPGPS